MRTASPILAAAFAALASPAFAAPPIEAYGELPEISHMAISPDGEHLAYMVNSGESEGLVVFSPATGVVGGVRIEEGTARRIRFATNDHVVVQRSTLSKAVRGEFEFSSAASYNFKTDKLSGLLREVWTPQSGLGNIIGRKQETNKVFMPAYVGRYLSVLEVDLDTGMGATAYDGDRDTVDWLITPAGVPIGREDFRRYDKRYTIRTKRNGKWEEVFSADVDEPPFYLVGMRADESALVVYEEEKNNGNSALYELSFAGDVSTPLFARSGSDIGDILYGMNREVLGVEFTGLYPSYRFFDADLTAAVADLQALLPGSSVEIADWTDNFSQVLVHASGSRRAPAYFLFERNKKRLSKIAATRPGIQDADVGEVLTIRYSARDGLQIPAIITLPPSIEKPHGLPLIVMPHGGPEAYDSVGFDWMAQYFASRGYLVFQPNFRGSGGFGVDFRNAGYGEWGGKMQDDITDGVARLVNAKWADPDRVCIIGWSYGGYAALAGGAFTPDLYKCVAAIAPVSDVRLMLGEVKRQTGSKSLSFKYWQDYIGDLDDESEKLKRISPANNGASFKAPVLLIHGDGDTVVPFIQSRRMEEALISAGKSVTFVKLKGEDHWLSQSDTRLQTLRALDIFVEQTIGRTTATASSGGL